MSIMHLWLENEDDEEPSAAEERGQVLDKRSSMNMATEEEFDEGRYDGPDAVVNEDEPL